MLDDPEAVLPDSLQLGQSSKEVPKDDQEDIDYEKRTLDASWVSKAVKVGIGMIQATRLSTQRR